MKLDIVKSRNDVGLRAAKFVVDASRKKPNLVLGLPTGATPLVMYRDILRLHRKGEFDHSKITTFNLDEYLGLAPDNKYSYAHFMEHMFLRFLPGINSHIPNGLTPIGQVPLYCKSYEDMIISSGGLDLTILGIGSDGHIGFNEPGSSFSSRTRLIELSEQTRKDNSRFFASINEVPRHAITMGIATIMDSRTVMLLATGKTKADILSRALNGSVTEDIPASILREHKNVIIIADEEAASKLDSKKA